MSLRYDVMFSAVAEADLLDIWRYIAGQESVLRADHVLDALEQTCAKLDQNPNRGNVPKELQPLGIAAYRELHWKPYRIVYEVRGRQVIVHCILDGRRDMQTLLRTRLVR